MAINLPHHLAEVINILGFAWPEIDEDQLKDAARELKSYAHECQISHDATHRVVTGDLPQVYAAQSYTALAELWGGQTQGHMKTLIEVCHGLAEALVIIAEAVTIMKDACPVQLGIAAAELTGDAIGSVATLGLSDAAAVAEIKIQNGLLDDIIKNFVQMAESTLISKLTGPLKEQLDHAVAKLLFVAGTSKTPLNPAQLKRAKELGLTPLPAAEYLPKPGVGERGGHAEQNILHFLHRRHVNNGNNGWLPTHGAATKNVCPDVCTPLIATVPGSVTKILGSNNKYKQFYWADRYTPPTKTP